MARTSASEPSKRHRTTSSSLIRIDPRYRAAVPVGASSAVAAAIRMSSSDRSDSATPGQKHSARYPFVRASFIGFDARSASPRPKGGNPYGSVPPSPVLWHPVTVPGDGPVGRGAELARVDVFLAAARADVRALAVCGPAGIGKTSVWQEGSRRAAAGGALVLTARPTGGEVKLSFAALADLLAPIDGGTLALLPDPQRRALDVALLRGDESGAPLDSRAVATGLLSLLRELALRTPVVLAVDDAQWLDLPSAAALEFAVRRLDGLPVGVLVSVRTDEARPVTFEQSLPREHRDDLE